MVSNAAIHNNVSPIAATGNNPGPASPTISTPIATIWITVFHLARRDTGMPTRKPARYSRSPETRISRHRMTNAGRSASAESRPKAVSMNNVAETSNLSAIGSRKRPISDCCSQRRAMCPSSQSVTPEPSAGDRSRRAEMAQQRLLAASTDPVDFIERGAPQGLCSLGPVRGDGKSMRFVAQPLQEVEDRVARVERERRASRDKEIFPP